MQWNRWMRDWSRPGVALMMAFLVPCALAACNLDSSLSGATSGIHPPSSAPTATIPAPGPPATLGAPGQAFIAKYGAPTEQSNRSQGDLRFHEYSGVAADYLIVEEGSYFSVSPGAQDAFSIQVAPPPSQSWTIGEAKRVCQGFEPPDAQFDRRVDTTSQGLAVGWDDIYQSAQLAKVFPASAFQDISQNPAPRGSFDISYLYDSNSSDSRVSGCTLTIGERQTVG
ncbi:MAG TPA: hypothetical protein VF808_12410 [Ktedonobacterales bacterium]